MDPITYAIGDVHGCKTELDLLLDAIADHAAGRPYELVFLGDYIDKGPDSAGVIETLMALQARNAPAVACIKGNHDDLMARAARGDEAAHAKWLSMDGASVLAQYGVRRAGELPAQIIAWIDAMPTLREDAHRYFVHAGLDPTRSLDKQSDSIRMSMRGAFLESDFDFGKHVAHGHTPQLNGRPELRPYRTNLDTGVVQTGCLTAAMFDASQGPPTTVLATRPGGKIAIGETALAR